MADFYIKQKKNKLATSNIIQGRNEAAGPFFQLRLAENLFSEDKKKKVLVDYPINFRSRNQKRMKTVYSDIIVTEGGIIKGVIEAKIDLGWLRPKSYGLVKGKKKGTWTYDRSLNEFKRKYNELVRSDEVSYRYPIGFSNPKDANFHLPRSKKMLLIFLLVTRQNDHNRSAAFAKSMRDAGFHFLCLLENVHPNEYPKTTVNLREWSDSIKKRIRDEISLKKNEIVSTFKKLEI